MILPKTKRVITGLIALVCSICLATQSLSLLSRLNPARLSHHSHPVASLDTMAPATHGWLNEDEVFFLREKNQGDFLCVKVNIHTLAESAIESVSPLLLDLEERDQIVHLQASPSGRYLAIITGNPKHPTRTLLHLTSGQSVPLGSSPQIEAWHEGWLSWLPGELGWVEWRLVEDKKQNQWGIRSAHIVPESMAKPLTETIWISAQYPWVMDTPFATEDGIVRWAQASYPDPQKRGVIQVNLMGVQQQNPVQSTIQPVGLTHEVEPTKWMQVRHSLDGLTWLACYQSPRIIPQLRFTQTFPFVGLRWQRIQLDLWHAGHNTTELKMEVEPNFFPEDLKLSPSGQSMSFVHQGKLMVMHRNQPVHGESK
jgi:hypothetical protein